MRTGFFFENAELRINVQPSTAALNTSAVKIASGHAGKVERQQRKHARQAPGGPQAPPGPTAPEGA